MMEVIADELKKNDVNVDVETLSKHIQYILNNYRDCFNDSVGRLTRELLLDVFHEINVNKEDIIKEDTVRQAVRLAAPVLRNTGRVEGGFIRELCSWGRSWVLNLWDIM